MEGKTLAKLHYLCNVYAQSKWIPFLISIDCTAMLLGVEMPMLLLFVSHDLPLSASFTMHACNPFCYKTTIIITISKCHLFMGLYLCTYI